MTTKNIHVHIQFTVLFDLECVKYQIWVGYIVGFMHLLSTSIIKKYFCGFVSCIGRIYPLNDELSLAVMVKLKYDKILL